MNRPGLLLALLAALAFVALEAHAAQWYMSPTGRSNGNGSITDPWDIVTGFGHPGSVHAGDTLWLRGGTYPIRGNLISYLTGTANAPILVRQYPRERATLDAGDSVNNRVFIQGAYCWHWGYELMSSGLRRWGDAARGYGIDFGNSSPARGLKLINLVQHDTEGAFGFWRNAIDGEIYGCLIYYNGYDSTDRGHGHAIYAQNDSGTKRMADNIMFGQYSHGIHAYGSSAAYLNHFLVEGNISFHNGITSTISGFTRNILVGGGRLAEDPRVLNNYAYFNPASGGGTSCDLGYGQGVSHAVVRDNYLVGGGLAFNFRSSTTTDTVSGNTFCGPVSGADSLRFPNNTYYGTRRPTGVRVFVRPNQYEPGRGNLCVFNWDNRDTVTADVSAILSPGDLFVVQDAQNFFGPPVLSGTYDGNPIRLPLNLTAAAPVIGSPARQFVHTPKEFNAFVLMRTGRVGVEEKEGLKSQGIGVGLVARPNPFSSFTTIPGHKAERFVLYDIASRWVGTYRGDRVGERLPAGVYFLRPEGKNAKPLRIVKLR